MSGSADKLTLADRTRDHPLMTDADVAKRLLAIEFTASANVRRHASNRYVNRAAPSLWQLGRGDDTFEVLETHHFLYEHLPDGMSVTWPSSVVPDSLVLLIGDDLVRQRVANNRPGVFQFSGLGALWREGNAQHVSLVPEFASESVHDYTGRTTVSLWLSRLSPGQPGREVVDWDASGADPSWRVLEAGSEHYLLYAGPVFDLLMDQPETLHIRVTGQSPFPVTSQFALFRLDNRHDLARARRFTQAPHRVRPDFPVRLLGSAVLRTKTTIHVTGPGQIDGQHLQERDLSNRWRYRGLPRMETFSLADVASSNRDEGVTYQEVMEYQLRSGLVTLSSASTSEFAITVDGLTVANAPRRHQAAINLNVVTVPMASLDELMSGEFDFDASNRPVRVSGLKVVGNWHDAADGPEVGGDGSLIESVFLHVADDAIKLAAKNVRYRDVTVLQGDAGGVMNIGSYGYNRGVEGSVVQDVHVHRVCHQLHGKHGIAQDDDRGGLITSRTGNFNFLGRGSDGLTGFTVNGLWVAPISGNSVSRVLALGVMGGRETTRTGFVARHAPVRGFRFGDIDVKNLNVLIPPAAPMLLYRQPMTGNNANEGNEVNEGNEGNEGDEKSTVVELVGHPGVRIEWLGPGFPELRFQDQHGVYDFGEGFVEVVSASQSTD